MSTNCEHGVLTVTIHDVEICADGRQHGRERPAESFHPHSPTIHSQQYTCP